jgi:hypothetical protein
MRREKLAHYSVTPPFSRLSTCRHRAFFGAPLPLRRHRTSASLLWCLIDFTFSFLTNDAVIVVCGSGGAHTQRTQLADQGDEIGYRTGVERSLPVAVPRIPTVGTRVTWVTYVGLVVIGLVGWGRVVVVGCVIVWIPIPSRRCPRS